MAPFQSGVTMLLLIAALTTSMMALPSAAFAVRPQKFASAATVNAKNCILSSTSSSPSSSQPFSPPHNTAISRGGGIATVIRRMSSTWDDFSYDDDDELLDSGVDSEFVAADENDELVVKAAAGMALEAPDVDWHGQPIDVPQGSQLELDEETVQGVLAACREEIGTMFGYQAENRGVGITGGVDFVELDGPTVVLHLKGRFWHQRPTVLSRVGSYLTARIPEIVDVVVADEYELTDEANDLAI